MTPTMYAPDQIKLRTITVETPTDFGRLPKKVEIGQFYTTDGKYHTMPSNWDNDFQYWRDADNKVRRDSPTVYPNMAYDYVFALKGQEQKACDMLNKNISA